MHVVLAWVSEAPPPPEWLEGTRRRADECLASMVPGAYRRVELGGPDWGLVAAICPEGAWRWPGVAQDPNVTAVSLGMPIGLDTTGGPVAMARRLLHGADVHAGVVPPFALLALDRDRRLVVQQDWLGMCRLFTGSRDGVRVLSSRPSLAAELLGPVVPDREGWSSYLSAGHFAGDTTPVAGIRLLHGGERFTARRREGGGWEVRTEIRHDVTAVVSAGLAARRGPLDRRLGLAAEGLAATAASIGGVYDGEIRLGLSGGKDSRLVAAALVAGGSLPTFATNEDTAVEGETARELVRILRDEHGLTPRHEVGRTGVAAVVHRVGLRERIRRLHLLHDYQYPSTYTVRRPGPPRLAAELAALSLGGAAGELACGYWYPAGKGGDRAELNRAAWQRLVPACSAMTDDVRARQQARVCSVLDTGLSLGLSGLELLDYAYLVEKVRRWDTSAYHPSMVSPFLTPAVVSATFALTPQEKQARVLHDGLIARFVPGWAAVPYVSITSGPSTATRIWDGDGPRALHGLLDTTFGDLMDLVGREAVTRSLLRCVHGVATTPDERTLQQFACLAMASQRLEPARVRAATQTYEEFVARAPVPVARAVPHGLSAVAARLRFVKRSTLGRAVWEAARRRYG
ncbi:MAG TPA: hypothetical protein VI011_13380 [Asanoa sp.]